MPNKDTKEEVLEYLEKEGVTLEDLKWMAQYHRSVSKYGDWVAKTIVTSMVLAILSGIGFLIWEGVQHVVAGLK